MTNTTLLMSRRKADRGSPDGSSHRLAWRDGTLYGNDHAYAGLCQAIGGDDPGIGTTPREALAINELTQMAYKSAEEGREIRREEFA